MSYGGPIEVGMKFNTHGCYDDVGTKYVEILGFNVNEQRYTYGGGGKTARISASTLRLYWTPVETACLDRATAKPAPVVWRAGMWATAVDKSLREPDFQIREAHAKSWNVSPPTMWKPRDEQPATTAPERRLAKGWKPATGWGCHGCKKAGRADYGGKSLYMSPAPEQAFYCEAHAAELGVFQDELPPILKGQAEALRKQFEQGRLYWPRPSWLKGVEITDMVIDETASFTEADWHKLTRIMQCKTCTHIHDIGKPCNGRSPFGHFACPCGHERVEAKREVRVVGRYGLPFAKVSPETDRAQAMHMYAKDAVGATATLLANLERERVPGRRPIRTVRWYEGNGDE